MTEANLNTRELCVNYPTWEQLINRFKYITEVVESELKDAGNVQYIDSVKIREHNGKYQIIYTLEIN